MQNLQQTAGITGVFRSRDIAMAFYNAFTRIGVSIQSQQGSGTVVLADMDKGGRGNGFIMSPQ